MLSQKHYYIFCNITLREETISNFYTAKLVRRAHCIHLLIETTKTNKQISISSQGVDKKIKNVT